MARSQDLPPSGGVNGTSGGSGGPRGEIVTIAVLPAGMEVAAPAPTGGVAPPRGGPANATPAINAPGVARCDRMKSDHPPVSIEVVHTFSLLYTLSLLAVRRLATALKESLGQYGPVLQLNSTSIGLLFPTAFEKLDVLFYRYCGVERVGGLNKT